MKFAIWSVSSDLMYLTPLKFYCNSKKKKLQKLKKPHYLINGEFDQKSALNKKDVKFNFRSDMFYQISCIFNQYRVIAVFMILILRC